MPDMNSIEEGNHLENEIKLLKPQELKTLLEAEIKKRLDQIEALRYELKTIPGIFAIAISRPDRLLTINENFTNEPFTELWVIPVAGGLKDQLKSIQNSKFKMGED